MGDTTGWDAEQVGKALRSTKRPPPTLSDAAKTVPELVRNGDRFLRLLASGMSVTSACEGAGINRVYAYQLRRSNPEFAAKWEEALESATDALEERARERAMESSDTLMIFLLKANRREKYAGLDRVAIVGDADNPVRVTDDRKPLEALLNAAVAAALTIEGEVSDGEPD